MKIYFSVDLEIPGGESIVNLKKLMRFLQEQGHTVYRAPYIFSENPDLFLQKEMGLNRKATYTEQREIHIKWINESDILLADISLPSEGRSMIIQRALDKPEIGLPFTPIILIKRKKIDRKFGKIIKGLIESGKVIYYEYENVTNVINNWPKLLKEAKKKVKI